jgi:MFS transporter, YNFM family, putative membrane transport protein
MDQSLQRVDVKIIPDHESPSIFRLLAIALCGFCPFLVVYVTQPLLPSFAKTWGATQDAVSATVTATTLAVALTAPFIGFISDALGRKMVIVIAIFGLAIPMALAATSTTLHQLVIWRFIQGLFIPGIFSVALAYIGEEWSGRNNGLATSAYVSGNVFGSVSGRVLAGFIAHYAGWHEAFIVLATLLVLGGIGVWVLLPNSKNFVPHRNILQSVRSSGQHFRNPKLLAVCVVGFNTLFAFVGVFTYITFRLSNPPFSLNVIELGSLFLLNLFGAVITPFAGRWMDRVGPRTVLVTALCASTIGLVLTLAQVFAVVCIGLALISAGVFVGNSASSSRLGAVSGKAKSSAAGLYVSIYYIGGSVGATVLGFAYANGGWPACVVLIIVVHLITGVVALRFWEKLQPR